MMKAILWIGSARRAFRVLPAKVRSRIEIKLARYADTGAGDVRILSPGPGRRLRVRDYRIIFVETDERIEVRAVGHRRDIYR
jgi:mRNA interferase RelE/StbE